MLKKVKCFLSLEELATYVEKGKNVFFFTADWCGDSREMLLQALRGLDKSTVNTIVYGKEDV